MADNPPKQLKMLRREAPIPDMRLPQGWRVRSMQEGDEEAWVSIMKSAGFFTDSQDDPITIWQKAMGSDARVKMEHVFLVCTESGKPVATATALLFTDKERDGYPCRRDGPGCLHNVGSMFEYRGKGAGTAVIIAVLRRLSELGFSDCVLNTDDFRIPAVKRYLELAWFPVLYTVDMRGRWEKILAELKNRSELAAFDQNWVSVAPIKVGDSF